MIKIEGRSLKIPTQERIIGWVGDNRVEVRIFELSRHYGDIDLAGFDFKLDTQSGDVKNIIDLDKTVADDKITLTWTVKESHILNPGHMSIQIRAFSAGEEKWHSAQDYVKVQPSINAEQSIPDPLPSEFVQMEQRVTQAKNEAVTAVEKAEDEVDRAQEIVDTFEAVTLPSAIQAVETAGQAKVDLAAQQANIAATKAQEALGSAERAKASEEAVKGVADEHRLKIAKIERELNDYKTIMSMVNINLEPKQQVSGYGIVSLPKNAANGQVSVIVKGLTATNLLAHDKFKGRTSAYTVQDLGDRFRCINDGAADRYNYFSYTEQNISIGDKVYIRAKFLVNTNGNGFSSSVWYPAVGLAGSEDKEVFTDYEENTVYEVSVVLTATDNRDRIFFTYQVPGGSINGHYWDIYKDCIAINLTKTFGAGNEPTKEECDRIFANWFNGTKSTISAGRIKSVGKNLFDSDVAPSYIYPSCIYTKIDNGFNLSGSWFARFSIKPLKKNTYYTLSATTTTITGTPNIKWAFRYSDGTSDSGGNLGSRRITDASKTVVSVNVYLTTASDVTASCDYTNIQLEEGSTATPYEPYTETTQYLPNVGELRSLPNGVSDEIKVSGGKAELVKRVSDTMEELAEPIITPINVSGNLISYPSGTVYVEPVVADAGVYTDKITVLHEDLPIKAMEKVSKVDFVTGLETSLNVANAVIAEDKISFTHPDLTDGDIVFFEYEYDVESTQGETKIEYYDSRYTIKDSVTDKFYKWNVTVADGVPSIELVEV